MRVGDAGRNCLGNSSSHHELEEIAGGLAFVGSAAVVSHQLSLEGLVDDEVDDCLRDAEVGGGDALVEPSQPRLAVDPAHALPRCHPGVQLKTRLYEPDGVGHGARRKTWKQTQQL